MYALKAKKKKRQYPIEFTKFFSFIGIEGSVQKKCGRLYQLSKDKDLLQSHLIRFINYQKERILDKDISEGTLQNYAIHYISPC